MPTPTIQKTSAAELLVDLFENLRDFQFEHRDINGGDLVHSLGAWMREHFVEYLALRGIQPEAGMRVLVGFMNRFSALFSVDNEVSGADLVDDVGEWLEATYPVMPVILGKPFAAQVVRSKEGEGYWSESYENYGWGELEDATAFFVAPPMGLVSQAPSSWRAVDLEAELFQLAQLYVDEAEAEATAPRG